MYVPHYFFFWEISLLKKLTRWRKIQNKVDQDRLKL